MVHAGEYSEPDCIPLVPMLTTGLPTIRPNLGVAFHELLVDRFLIADVLLGLESMIGWPAHRFHDWTNARSLQSPCTDWRRRYGCRVPRAG
jgi:hypothetical protein